MSVQLIVYPQTFDGEFNSYSSTSTEALVNGINFTGLNSTTSTDASGSLAQLLVTTPPSIVNTWYRFRTTSAGTPSVPTESNGDLVLDSTTTYTEAGVYQKLTNLTVGQQYTFTITTGTTGTGNIYMRVLNGTSLVHQAFGSAGSAQVTSTFTATAPDNTVIISYQNTGVDNITIGTISLNPQGVTPNTTTFELENGQVICDLYEDEDIPLSLSVDNFKNVAEKVQSYSKAFKLPATKRNNLIFDNMFEITRSDDGIIFNPYNKTECVLKQDGFILFKGYLKMLDINDKEGEISYNVNLYSEVVALADILKDRTFSELDFTELEHDYNRTQITYSWNDSVTGITYTNPSTSGFRNAYSTVKYPFIDWNHQYGISDGTQGPTGRPVLPNLESAFRPCIQLKYLINRIFEETPFTWESSFFDSADFGKLYMDFNWGAENAPVVFTSSGELTNAADFSIAATFTTLPFDEMNYLLVGGAALDTNFGYSAGVFTAQEDGQVYTFDYSMVFNRSISADTLTVQWLVNGIPVNIHTSSSVATTYSGNFTTPSLAAGDTVLCQAISPAGHYELDGVLSPFGVTPSLITVTTTVNQTTNETLLETLRGELGQWDFLKGIMTMFNLVSLPDEDNPNNIKFEPYGDVFISDTNSSDINNMTLAARSIQHDWTDRIDVAEMKLTPLTDLNKDTIFKFVEDDDDFCFMEYKRQVGGHLYGSKKYDASLASNGLATVLQGTEEIVAEPFAATLSDTLMSQYPGIVVPKIYAMSDDETEGFDNAPRILYNNGIKDSGITYYIPAQNGVTYTNKAGFLQFSHLTDIPTVVSSPPAITDTSDFHFGMCQLPNGLGASTPRNLFNLYWLPYYQELYNPDTRTMTIKVNLSPSIINTFKFNDTVMIKNRVFRCNRIDYKPNDLATVEFILIP